MAVNTKIDLYDGKVEQCSGELLHLSGCTHVYGEFLIQSGGTISILNNRGTGKILTSDSGGIGTWQTIGAISGTITGATNGLSVTGQKIKLGGLLTGDTVINLNSHNFCFNDGSGTNYLNIVSSACTANYGPSNKAAGITNLLGYCTCLTQSISGAVFTDNSVPTPKGLAYANDYSGGYTCLSIPHVGWVTGQTNLSVFIITGNSTATGFTINHAKNKQFVSVEIVKNSSPYPTVYTNVQRTNTNCVCITFDTAPANGQQYKILITS
jgi:hypothetical protein